MTLLLGWVRVGGACLSQEAAPRSGSRRFPAHRGCRVSLHEGKEKGHSDPLREEAAALGLVPAEAIHSLKLELLSR